MSANLVDKDIVCQGNSVFTNYQYLDKNTNITILVKKKIGGNYIESVTVLYKNASSKAWRGVGNTSMNFAEALSRYKKKSIRQAIIDCSFRVDGELNQ